MRKKVSRLFVLATLDHRLDAIRSEVSTAEYDEMRTAIQKELAAELAEALPLSLGLLPTPERKDFLDLARTYEHDLEKAVEHARVHYEDALAHETRVLSSGLQRILDPKKILEEAKRLRAADQSRRSKGKPKKRKGPTAKSVTVAAMRKARKAGQTLVQFLAAAEAGSVEQLEIKPEPLRGVVRYAIEAEELIETARVAHGTLEEWFTEAGRRATPD